MLKALVEFAIRFRGVVIGLACLTVGYGLYVAAHAKMDVFPEFAPPQVIVQTEAPGLSAEQVEALVTRPVENGVNGVGDLERIRSQSIQGLSVLIAIFREGTDILKAHQMVSERLVQVSGQLPLGVHAPKMMPLTSSTSLVLSVGITSEKRSLMDLRTFADWTLRPRLLGVPGVANVETFGGEVRQLQVQLRPERLIAYDLSISDVLDAARRGTAVVGAGFVETENQRIPIRTEGQSLTAAELGETVVGRSEAGLVRLKDVSTVLDAPEPKVGDAAINGVPGVLLNVWGQYGTNTLVVTQALEAALEELGPAVESEGIRLESRLFRPASFIEISIHNVNVSLLLGGILVALVLTLFLFNLRTAFISLTAIPISLLAAVIILEQCGVTLNTLTLGGFAIAIGEVVDDAIIDVENIFRRLKENRLMDLPRPAFHVVLEASLEVRSAVVYATFVVALVFLPVLTMSGVQGKLFAPLGMAYILATLASLGVALTLTPALSCVLLARAAAQKEPRYLLSMRRAHSRWLGSLAKHPALVLGGALVLCAGAAAMLPTFGGEFLPELMEGHFIIQMSALPGTSAPESMRIGRLVSKDLLGNHFVQSVALQVGRAELGEDTVGTDFSELKVAVKPFEGDEEAELAQFELRGLLARFPGVKFAVKTFLTERIEETISGSRAEVAVRIYGHDLDVIDQKAEEVERLLGTIPGTADLLFVRTEEPQIVVRLRPDRLKQFGLRPLEVLEAVQTGYQGTLVAQTFDGDRVFDVEVTLDEHARKDPESLRSLLLRTALGVTVPLEQLAEIYVTTGRHAILHDGARRYQEVSCNVRGRDLASFVEEARRRIAAEVQFPAGIYAAFEGAAEAQARARQEILRHSVLAGVGVVLLLAIVFRRARNLLLVLVNLPFALLGGVLAVFLTGGVLNVGSLVGFVTLFGITMRNSILLVSHYEHLVSVEGLDWGPETALRGASERLVPILMTALVTALGLLPIAIGTGAAGREIEGPMAIVILGGLATSTLLNLLVLPTIALRYGRFEV